MTSASTEPARLTHPDKIHSGTLYVILRPDLAPGLLGHLHAFTPVASGAELATALAPPRTFLERVGDAIDALLHPFRAVVADPLTDGVRRRAIEVGIRPYEPQGHDAGLHESCRLAHNAAHAGDGIPRWLAITLAAGAIGSAVFLSALTIAAIHAVTGTAPLLWAGGYAAVCVLAFGVLPRVLGRDAGPA